MSERPGLEFRPDQSYDDAWLVLDGGTEISHVDLADPTRIRFDYMRLLAVLLDALPGGPRDVVHVGGAGCTMARYVEATRPGSRQLVVDPDQELVTAILERLPLPTAAQVRFSWTDGRSALAELPEQSADAVLVDAFVDGQVPPDLTTHEAIADAARVLRPDGMLLVNAVSHPGDDWTRRFTATVRTALPHAALLSYPTILRGMRYGNVVLVAGSRPLPVARITEAALGLERPQQTVADEALLAYVDDAEPFTDATVTLAPGPPPFVLRRNL